jgi:hypothetical protein
MKRKIHRLLFNIEKPKMYEKVSGKTMGIFPFLYMKGWEIIFDLSSKFCYLSHFYASQALYYL